MAKMKPDRKAEQLKTRQKHKRHLPNVRMQPESLRLLKRFDMARAIAVAAVVLLAIAPPLLWVPCLTKGSWLQFCF